MTEAEIEKMATEIKDFLIEHEMWQDVRIYFNKKAFATDNGKGDYTYSKSEKVFILNDIDPKSFFEYADGILSMSFEGPLYNFLNYYPDSSTTEDFNAIFNRHDCYYELGDPWNLSVYPM